MEEIIQQIQARRESLKISQQDLAEMSGVSLRTINAFESRKANPSLEILLKMLAPLGLKLTLSERVKIL